MADNTIIPILILSIIVGGIGALLLDDGTNHIDDNGVKVIAMNAKDVEVKYNTTTKILSATGNISDATIILPKTKSNNVLRNPKLMVKIDDKSQWEEVVPYYKNITIFERRNKTELVCDHKADLFCLHAKNVTTYYNVTNTTRKYFNQLKINKDSYEFDVEHFSSYYVNSSGGDYATLTDCLTAINNTNGDYCIINAPGVYALDGSKYNISGVEYVGVITIASQNVTLDCKGSTLTGGGNTYSNIFGVYYYRQGGNVTVLNCNMEHYNKGYYIDVYSDYTSDLNIRDCTSYGTVDYEYLVYSIPYISNFTQIRGSGMYLGNSIGTGSVNDTSFVECVLSNYWCLFNEGGTNTVFRRLNITIEEGSSNQYAVYTGGGHFYDSYIKHQLGHAFYYPYTVQNTTIEDCDYGIEVGFNITNNTFRNITYESISGLYNGLIDSRFEISNNRFINTGYANRTLGFKSSFSPIRHGGVDYDAVVEYVDSALNINVVSEDENIISVAEGTRNFYLCVLDVGGAGITAYIDPNIGLTCEQVAAAYGATYICSQDNYISANGAETNYTVASLSGCDGYKIGVTNPLYLRAANDSNQLNYTIDIDVAWNDFDISKNILTIDDGRQNYYFGKIAGSLGAHTTTFWLNHFYYPPVYSNNVNFCNNGEGNFWEESLIPNETDCGQIDIISQDVDKALVSISGYGQDSILPLSYVLLADGYKNLGNFESADISAVFPASSSNFTIYAFDGTKNSTKKNFALTTIPYLQGIINLYDNGFLSIQKSNTKWEVSTPSFSDDIKKELVISYDFNFFNDSIMPGEPFDPVYGYSLINDQSGNGHNSYTNYSFLSYGVSGGSYLTNKSRKENYMVPESTAIPINSQNLSLSVWINSTNGRTANPIFISLYNSGRFTLMKEVQGNPAVDANIGMICIYDGASSSGTTSKTSRVTMGIGQLAMWTCVKNSTNLMIYKNTTLMSSVAADPRVLNGAILQIGSNSIFQYPNATFDNFRFWNRTISPAEIARLYSGDIQFSSINIY